MSLILLLFAFTFGVVLPSQNKQGSLCTQHVWSMQLEESQQDYDEEDIEMSKSDYD